MTIVHRVQKSIKKNKLTKRQPKLFKNDTLISKEGLYYIPECLIKSKIKKFKANVKSIKPVFRKTMLLVSLMKFDVISFNRISHRNIYNVFYHNQTPKYNKNMSTKIGLRCLKCNTHAYRNSKQIFTYGYHPISCGFI